METEIINQINEKFGNQIIHLEQKSEKNVFLTVEKEALVEVVKYLFNNLGGRFCTASALETFQGIEILYHFSFDKLNKIVTIKTLIKEKNNPEIESITPVIRGAEWIEREIHDFLGVKFVNHPDLRRFILADDFPENVYPFRKK